MRVLVTGGYGFIGSAIVARLSADGFDVVGAGRRVVDARHRRPDLSWIETDFARLTRAEDWIPHLAGIDAVVNCVGVLQDSRRDSTYSVHVEGASALFTACERAGIQRVIQISAIGVGADLDTDFARTKAAGDDDLMRRDIGWVVLRPSLVIGRTAYGGTALIRGLAAFPSFVPIMNGDALLQPVHVDELAATVAFFLRPDAPLRRLIEIAGPERMTLAEIVATYRRWLGLKPARFVHLPDRLAAIIYRLGDAMSLLGWRSPVRTTSARQLARGVVGDSAEWTRLTRIQPKTLAAVLATDPASAQERWFARLYLLKPLIIGVLAVFWLVTGILTLGLARPVGIAYLREAGFGEWSPAVAIGGALLDVMLGLAIAWRPTTRLALVTTLVITPIYLLLAALLAPQVWIDPLGPMIKVFPILVLTIVALAILDER